MTKEETTKVMCAYAFASATKGQDYNIKHNRPQRCDAFMEYLQNFEIADIVDTDIGALVRDYLENDNMHKFEIAKETAKARKAAEEKANALIMNMFGI